MKGDRKILQFLNRVLTKELTAINQYFLHSRMFENWGYARLHEHEHHESIDAMKRADAIIRRVLFLEGLPNLQNLDKLLIGENAVEALSCDLQLECDAHALLKEAVAACETAGDYVSRDLLTEMLESKEAHIDWLETQRDLIDSTGLQNYLQSQLP